MPKFTKGHTLSRGKRKPGGGRKKTPSTLIREAIEKNDQRLPGLFDNLYELAVAGDREATINLIDRSLGKVKAKTELEISRGIDTVSVEDVLEFRKMMDKELKSPDIGQRTLLPEGVTSPEIDENTPQEEE